MVRFSLHDAFRRFLSPHLRRLRWLAAIALAVGATAGHTQDPSADEAPSKDAEEWIERWGDRWTERYHPDVDEQYPGGRSDRFHRQYVAEALMQRPDLATDDWKIFNKHYMYDGDWFIVEWLYQSTHVATGKVQRESTVAFGKIEDDRLRIWIEYFDDMVGHYQWIGAMKMFELDEEPYPWPAETALRRAYRP